MQPARARRFEGRPVIRRRRFECDTPPEPSRFGHPCMILGGGGYCVAESPGTQYCQDSLLQAALTQMSTTEVEFNGH